MALYWITVTGVTVRWQVYSPQKILKPSGKLVQKGDHYSERLDSDESLFSEIPQHE